jgi:hypothetical protein
VSDTVEGFRIEELLDHRAELRIYRAYDEHIEREVLLRVADAPSAVRLLEDARLIAGVADPGLITVLRAGLTEAGGYAAMAAVSARPLGDVGSLSSEQAVRVATDITGAISALAGGGWRVPITPATVLVDQNDGRVRGILDPLSAMSGHESCLTDADVHASTAELLDLIEQFTHGAPDELSRAVAELRSRGGTSPDELLKAFAALSPPQHQRSRARPRVAALLIGAVVAIGIAVLFLVDRGGSSRPTRSSQTPVARIVGRIPLGLSGQEEPVSIVTLPSSVWVATTAGRLLRIDPVSNQVVGTPIRVAGHHPFSSMVSSGGALYTTDDAGWLLRIDPHTGHVTGRRRLGADLTASAAEGNILWLTSGHGNEGLVLRVNARTLRTLGRPLRALPDPRAIQVQGSRAWVGGYTADADPAVIRIDSKSSGRRAIAFAGVSPVGLTLDGKALWIPDGFAETVSALDATRMRFDRPALLAARSPASVVPVGADLWVVAYAGLGSGPLRLERFDARSGKRTGSTVTLGVGGRLVTVDYGLGSLWVTTAAGLVRLGLGQPRAAVEPSNPPERSPRRLTPGPLPPGVWRPAQFAAPFTFSTSRAGYAWFASYPFSDTVYLSTTHDHFAELAITAPRQIFATDRSLRDVDSPRELLSVLRHNTRLQLSRVRHILIGGRPAWQSDIRVSHAVHHPAVCGPTPCVLEFPLEDATTVLPADDVARIAALRSSGRTLVITESAPADDPAGLATATALLRTFHFNS